MFLADPDRTPYDLNFSFFGFAVRVHPLFWLVSLLMAAERDPKLILIWVVVLFPSILIHEFGHALAFRYYGTRSRIVLYSFGGLAIPEGAYGVGRSRRSGLSTTTGQIIVAFAGPAAGFVLAGLAMVALVLVQREVIFEPRLPFVDFSPSFRSPWVNAFVADLIWVNIGWGLVNLLPIFPLDGGQISRAVFISLNPIHGEQQSLTLSIAAAIGMALYGITAWQSTFVLIFFGYLAFQSYQMLQGPGGGYRGRRW